MLLLFVIAIFSGAGLLFLVQPMIAKQLLPMLGGSPAVWNTCMLFFQLALLAGYFYAHMLARIPDRRRQLVVHVVVIALAMLTLPIGMSEEAAPQGDGSPSLWLLLTLASSVGAPFFVLASASPLLQRWFAQTEHKWSADPYFLYAASNAGSMLALLGYPFWMEPSMVLGAQLSSWSWGFGAFALLALTCAATTLRSNGSTEKQVTEQQKSKGENQAITTALRWRWIALAFVPSSLMLGVTQHISTDVATTPMLWVVPLAIYLATFIVAFTKQGRVITAQASRLVPFVSLAVGMLLIALLVDFSGFQITVHLIGLAIVGLACHGRLAEERPSAQHLTEFYLLLSVGGALGGVFNALLAPVLFNWVAEYPIALLLACFLLLAKKPGAASSQAWWHVLIPRVMDIPAMILVFALFYFALDISNWFDAEWFMKNIIRYPPYQILRAILPALGCLVFFMDKRAFAMGLLVLFCLPQWSVLDEKVYTSRTFFGVHKVTRDPAGKGYWHLLKHGSTDHGYQYSLEPLASHPTMYYTRSGPAGDLMAVVKQSAGPKHLALVGLGSGALAAYGQPGWQMTYFEIDPEVLFLAKDSGYFTYLKNSKAKMQYKLGDARLQLAKDEQKYDAIFLDAFSSDAIPIHLITKQAVELYLDRLKPGGLLTFHTTNRHLDLNPVLGNIAADLKLTALWRYDRQVTSKEFHNLKKQTCRWIALARKPEDLGKLRTDKRWMELKADRRKRTWTDDYSNIWGVMR